MTVARMISATIPLTGIPAAACLAALTTKTKPIPNRPPNGQACASICISQLSTSSLDGKDRKVVGLLIDALDENGYLAQDLEELAELLPDELEITIDDLETALVQLQHLTNRVWVHAIWASAWPCNSKRCRKTPRSAIWLCAW